MDELDFENLSAWLDGEADEETTKLVESTFQSDGEAAIACADLRKLDNLLNEWKTPKPTQGLEEMICIAAKNSDSGNFFSKPTKLFRLRYLIPLATAALFVIAVLAITTPWDTNNSDPSVSSFDWQAMPMSQRLQARREARAYLSLSPQQQKQMLDRSAKELSLITNGDSSQKHLGAVMASFSKTQIAELKKLSLEKRMQVIQSRQKELISKGIIRE